MGCGAEWMEEIGVSWESLDEPIMCYGDDDGDGDMMFSRRCTNCGRFIKMPEVMGYKQNGMGDLKDFTKAECSKCGEIEPVFIGYY